MLQLLLLGSHFQKLPLNATLVGMDKLTKPP